MHIKGWELLLQSGTYSRSSRYLPFYHVKIRIYLLLFSPQQGLLSNHKTIINLPKKVHVGLSAKTQCEQSIRGEF